MDATLPGAWRALWLATLAFAANFSVWILYAVLGIDIQEQLQLSGTELGILLSAPIVSGALLRIPVGILSEYYSARTLWIWQMVITIPVRFFFYPFIETYAGFIWMGLWIGLSGGISFTLGVRYVTDWFLAPTAGPRTWNFWRWQCGRCYFVYSAAALGDVARLAVDRAILCCRPISHVAIVYRASAESTVVCA